MTTTIPADTADQPKPGWKTSEGQLTAAVVALCAIAGFVFHRDFTHLAGEVQVAIVAGAPVAVSIYSLGRALLKGKHTMAAAIAAAPQAITNITTLARQAEPIVAEAEKSPAATMTAQELVAALMSALVSTTTAATSPTPAAPTDPAATSMPTSPAAPTPPAAPDTAAA